MQKCDGLRKRYKNTDSPICLTLSLLLPPPQRQFRDREHSRPQSPAHFGQRHKSSGQKERGSGDESGPGMASYRKSLPISHNVMEMCFLCCMDTKYKCLRCELPICNKCSELYVMRVFSYYCSQLTVKLRGPTSTVFRHS